VTALLDHHRETIERAVARLRAREDVRGVLVGGSIAHGYATPTSDVDLMIVVDDADFERRLAAADATELDVESATYEGGYVDSKVVSLAFIRDVAERGNEPSRFAFQGAIVAWSGIDGLEDAVRAAARYPIEGTDARIRSFHAHLEYWRWIFGEGVRLDNAYVRAMAAPNAVLFAARLVLADNAVLYPGYKWLFRVLRDVPRQPPGLVAAAEAVIATPTSETVDALFELVTGWRDWGVAGQRWGAKFVLDTELVWLHDRPAVAEL
jgi:predicted nucleotidyltransferase